MRLSETFLLAFGWTLAALTAATLLVWLAGRVVAALSAPAGRTRLTGTETVTPQHVCVLVLGDVGRSPRMSYHALSLAEHGFSVSLVGYRGMQPADAIRKHDRIVLRYIHEPIRWPALKSRMLFLLMAPVKVLVQVLCLCWTLFVHLPRTAYVLVQNPPSIPTLLLAQLLVRWHGSRLVIDWHNFGYSLVALRMGNERHWLVRLAKKYEIACGQYAYAHLAVTSAMSDVLADKWRVSSRPIVLHDKPPAHFGRLSREEIHHFLVRVQHQELHLDKPTVHETLLTRSGHPHGDVHMRTDRCALIVSGTSWTEDEDFGLLVDALRQYACIAEMQPHQGLARLIVVITGNGPLRAHYEKQFAKLECAIVRVRTAWLRAEDYPRLLGCADLGLSFHTSSSGLDLPMKVVDMFGCGLPVCAMRFQCIGELVQHERNGLLFSTANELCAQFVRLFNHWAPSVDGEGTHILSELATGAAAIQRDTWQSNWDTHALPIFATPTASR